MNAEKLMNEAKELQEQIVSARRYLHTHPETGFDLNNTVEFVMKELREMGYDPKRCGKAGVTATVGGKKPGKVIMLRADMDALPLPEDSGEPFSSEVPGKMHACGHDMHTSMLLGAAKLLKAHEDELEGTVKLDFQPAEEIFEGAHDTIQAGILKNPDVDAAVMIHVLAGMPIPAGALMVGGPGVTSSACDFFKITVKGKGCHGSTPNLGIDPINVAAHIIIALQEIHAREITMNDKVALTICSIHGGATNNVIPDTLEMTGSLRTYHEEARAEVKARMVEITESVGKTFRAEANLEFTSGCPTFNNSAQMVSGAVKYGRELFGQMFIDAGAMKKDDNERGSSAGGSEDFAYVSQEVPTVQLCFSTVKTSPDGKMYPVHNSKVCFDDSVLYKGTAAYAYYAMRWLEDNK